MIEQAGAEWCARFPGSAQIEDLAEPFRTNVKRFIVDLERQGCTVHVSATYRPPERAYLMHWCCKIAGYRDRAGAYQQEDPRDVPAMAGVDIDWTCDNQLPIARTRAIQMREAYGIVYPAALVSRHTQRRAIDMTVKGWPGNATSLYLLGRTFRVFKLESDAPHWSDDGH